MVGGKEVTKEAGSQTSTETVVVAEVMVTEETAAILAERPAVAGKTSKPAAVEAGKTSNKTAPAEIGQGTRRK